MPQRPNNMKYSEVTQIIADRFPAFRASSDFDPDDMELPYILGVQLLSFIGKKIEAGDETAGDAVKALFDLINYLSAADDRQIEDLVGAGFFEGMTSGSYPYEAAFAEAAAKYLSPPLYDQFRFIRSGRAGTIDEFLKYEKDNKDSDKSE